MGFDTVEDISLLGHLRRIRDLERRVERLEFEMDRLLTRRPERPRE